MKDMVEPRWMSDCCLIIWSEHLINLYYDLVTPVKYSFIYLICTCEIPLQSFQKKLKINHLHNQQWAHKSVMRGYTSLTLQYRKSWRNALQMVRIQWTDCPFHLSVWVFQIQVCCSRMLLLCTTKKKACIPTFICLATSSSHGPWAMPSTASSSSSCKLPWDWSLQGFIYLFACFFSQEQCTLINITVNVQAKKLYSLGKVLTASLQ